MKIYVLGHRQKDADKIEPPKRPFEPLENVDVLYWRVAWSWRAFLHYDADAPGLDFEPGKAQDLQSGHLTLHKSAWRLESARH